MNYKTSFDGEVANVFDDYANTVRGHIRYELMRENVLRLAGTVKPFRSNVLSVIDVGGGAARDAVTLARLGHQVLVVDPSEDQINKGKQRVAQQTKAVQKRIEFMQSTLADLPRGQGPFDLTLAHAVMMYIPRPNNFIDRLGAITHRGGYVSLLERGYNGLYARLAAKGDRQAIKELQDTGAFINNMGLKAYATTPERTIYALRTIGAYGQQAVHYSGVRVAYDHDNRIVNTVPADELKAIVDVERELGHGASTKGMAHLLHFTAQITI